MNLVDVGILVILAFVALRGYRRGLVREVFAIAGIVAGVLLALQFHTPLSREIEAQDPIWGFIAEPAAIGAIFVGAMLAATLLGLLVRKLVQALLLGGVDRVGGVLFAVARGVSVLAIFLATMTRMLPPQLTIVKVVGESRLGPPLSAFGLQLIDVVRTRVQPAEGQMV